MDYNATKGGVDNMDKLVSAYSFKRRTLRWPLAIFFNILDIPAYNAFITWMALNPEWKRGKLQRIRLFLEVLGDTGETLNPEKTTCSKNLSLCSHREEDSGGQCWCPIQPCCAM